MLLALLCLLAITPAHAASGTPLNPSIGKVEVTLDLPKDKPYVGEMIMLRMRSFIRAYIVLDEVRQPPLVDFDVQQLGRDKPIEAMVDGFQVQGIERDLAIFPQQSGRLIIPPFVRHVTVANDDGTRSEGEFASKPVYVDIQNFQATNPRRRVVAAGEVAHPHRHLVARARRDPARQSHAPHHQGRGRRHDRGSPAAGPRDARARHHRLPRPGRARDDDHRGRPDRASDLPVRPAAGDRRAGPAAGDRDSLVRHERAAHAPQTAVPERWVAYLGTFVHTRLETVASLRERIMTPGPIAAGLAGFAWTAVLAGFVLTRGPRDPDARRIRRLLARLGRRARFGDEPGFRAAAAELARRAPTRWARVAGSAAIAPRLAALDGARYGRGDTPGPALAPLAADIRRGWRTAETRAEARERECLPPLDGDVAAVATPWATWLDKARGAAAWRPR